MTESAVKPLLTQDYLAKSSGKHVFEPKSLDEVQYIADQLLAMGFRYYKPEYAQNLQDAVQGSIYLDGDKTIMVSPMKTEGPLQHADEFGLNVAPVRPLQADIMQGKFAFFPRSVAEGRGVLLSLRAAGVELPEEVGGTFAAAVRALRYGLLLQEGKLSFAPQAQELQGAKILTPFDLGVVDTARISPEQSGMLAAFNEMAARMEQMSARIERLEKEIIPAPMEKSKVPFPKASR